ncbi:unnamed protein product [Nippostrongylus brasiliensis]|uniref:Uncharacterized protein n=1 Tax=Nippostrongylus brasiliensis TaxID=27835 RepID=A0A0N4XCA3_NIPBR|nr:unnamed protein product [Nippostrongylus brasiliensis]
MGASTNADETDDGRVKKAVIGTAGVETRRPRLAELPPASESESEPLREALSSTPLPLVPMKFLYSLHMMPS